MPEALATRDVMPVIRAGAPPPLPAAERARLVRRTRALAWVGIGWHVIECAVAVAA